MADRSLPPFVDEHRVLVAAPAGAVWRALGDSLRSQGRRAAAYGALVGADPARAAGDPLRPGSTLPGFEVREAVPEQRLVLVGRHRFSDYELVFGLDRQDRGTVLTARTRAAFPGAAGRIYRALVIASGAHRVLVRRWLRAIGRAAERG